MKYVVFGLIALSLLAGIIKLTVEYAGELISDGYQTITSVSSYEVKNDNPEHTIEFLKSNLPAYVKTGRKPLSLYRLPNNNSDTLTTISPYTVVEFMGVDSNKWIKIGETTHNYTGFLAPSSVDLTGLQDSMILSEHYYHTLDNGNAHRGDSVFDKYLVKTIFKYRSFDQSNNRVEAEFKDGIIGFIDAANCLAMRKPHPKTTTLKINSYGDARNICVYSSNDTNSTRLHTLRLEDKVEYLNVLNNDFVATIVNDEINGYIFASDLNLSHLPNHGKNSISSNMDRWSLFGIPFWGWWGFILVCVSILIMVVNRRDKQRGNLSVINTPWIYNTLLLAQCVLLWIYGYSLYNDYSSYAILSSINMSLNFNLGMFIGALIFLVVILIVFFSMLRMSNNFLYSVRSEFPGKLPLSGGLYIFNVVFPIIMYISWSLLARGEMHNFSIAQFVNFILSGLACQQMLIFNLWSWIVMGYFIFLLSLFVVYFILLRKSHVQRLMVSTSSLFFSFIVIYVVNITFICAFFITIMTGSMIIFITLSILVMLKSINDTRLYERELVHTHNISFLDSNGNVIFTRKGLKHKSKVKDPYSKIEKLE